MTYWHSLLISSLIIVFTHNFAYGAATSRKDYRTKPDAIINEIKSRGAKAVVLEVAPDSDVWDAICGNIATGDQAWLKAAVALHAGTDAGWSEMLDLALGEALEHSPERVLKIAIPNFELQFVCSAPDVDNARYDSYDLSLKAINLRIQKVTAIKDPKLKSVAKECIRYLEESKKGLAQFFETEKK
jgi:hypothetical protein